MIYKAYKDVIYIYSSQNKGDVFVCRAMSVKKYVHTHWSHRNRQNGAITWSYSRIWHIFEKNHRNEKLRKKICFLKTIFYATLKLNSIDFSVFVIISIFSKYPLWKCRKYRKISEISNFYVLLCSCCITVYCPY